MTEIKSLKDCTPEELQSYVLIVRLAADLSEKGVLETEGDDPESFSDAIYETIDWLHTTSNIITHEGTKKRKTSPINGK